MRLLFERGPDKARIDYIEIILTERELERLEKTGIVDEFIDPIVLNHSLNIFIRVDKYATQERLVQESYKQQHKRNGTKRTSPKTGARSRPLNRKRRKKTKA